MKSDIDIRWEQLSQKLMGSFKKTPDVNAVLYLIGIQELGRGFLDFTKEQKQDLLHIATCKVLSFSGHYVLDGVDKDSWPHWKLIKKMPSQNLKQQEDYLKYHILEYFSDIYPL